MQSEEVQEVCAGRLDLGCGQTSTWRARASQGLSLLIWFFVCLFVFKIWKSYTHLFAAWCTYHTTEIPPCSKVIRFSYTCRGICDPLRSKPQDSRGSTSVPGRMFSSSYISGNHEGMTACLGSSDLLQVSGEKSCYSGSALVFQLHFTSSVGQSLEDAVNYPSLGQREPES